MKKIIFIFSIFAVFATVISAQNSTLLFGSTYIPQSNSLNPAFYPDNNTFYISLPSITQEIHIPVSYNDIFLKEGSSDERYMNAWDLAKLLKDDNNLFINTDIQHLGFGIRIRNLFVTFSSRTKLNIHFGVPTGVVSLFADELKGHESQRVTVSEPNLLQTTAYNEYALGGGYTLGNLTVGARVKFLNGICDFRTTQTDFSMQFDENSQLSEVLIKYYALSSGYQLFRKHTSVGDALKAVFTGKNMGMAFDLGAKFKWNFLEVSASVLDIGKGIHWKNDVVQIYPHENTAITVDNYDFGHIAIDNWDTLQSVFQGTLDSIQTNDSTMGGDYWSPIPTKINLGATVTLGKMCRAGLLFHGEWDKDISCFDKSGNPIDKTMFRHATSLVFGLNLANWVEVMASLGVVKDGNNVDWFNPGLGVNFSFSKCIQFYALANYVSSLRYTEAKSANIQFGINLMFGGGFLAKAVNNDD